MIRNCSNNVSLVCEGVMRVRMIRCDVDGRDQAYLKRLRVRGPDGRVSIRACAKVR